MEFGFDTGRKEGDLTLLYVLEVELDEGNALIEMEFGNSVPSVHTLELMKVLSKLADEIRRLRKDRTRLELQLKAAKAVKNQEIFKWHKCTRKNGTEFLKLIYYSPDANGYVEAGRFNISKSETEWSIDEILKELI